MFKNIRDIRKLLIIIANNQLAMMCHQTQQNTPAKHKATANLVDVYKQSHARLEEIVNNEQS